jgi:hypothetical protein
VLASRDTPFEDIRSSVSIRRSGIVARDLRVHGQNFEVSGKGSLESSGKVDFAGTLLVSNEVSAEVVAMVPFAGRLLDEKGQLAVPFEVDGTWPDVRSRVNLELVASRAMPLPRLAVIWFGPAFGRAG